MRNSNTGNDVGIQIGDIVKPGWKIMGCMQDAYGRVERIIDGRKSMPSPYYHALVRWTVTNQVGLTRTRTATENLIKVTDEEEQALAALALL